MRASAAAAIVLALAGCERPRRDPAPAGGWPPGTPPPAAQGGWGSQPGGWRAPQPGWGAPPPGYAPHATATVQPQQAPRPPTIGDAVTAFGVLLQQLPQLPQPLPPLPTMWDWSQVPWPFPWAPPPRPQGPGPQPQQPPPPAPSGGVPFEDEVLGLTNMRRASGAVCGGKPFGPAAPLGPHELLRNAARGHSRDMALRGYFSHTSPEGAGPSDRALAAGYSSTFVGENIAAGQNSPAEVVQGWMESPGHCVNIMDPRYRVLGVGYFFQQGGDFRHFWTQNFGG